MLTILLATLALAGPPNVVLISMDTTRADALSCYGRLPGLSPQAPAVTTPVLDGLAAEGLRFEHFYAHAPTTLSSHTSLLSGRDPHRHAVPRNGYELPEGFPTLPERLADHGYDTIGVVAAKALEAKMGLNRGFRVYDDRTPTLRTRMYQERGDRIVDRALQHVDERGGDQALFLFVHFYDPHAPYEAPAPFFDRFQPPGYSGRYTDGMQSKLKPVRALAKRGVSEHPDIAAVNGLYQGEVAYVDHQIGRLLDGLTERGLLDDALLVVTADHGEMLHEHPGFSYSHGSDTLDATLRVPLIWKAYGPSIAARRGVVQRSADMSGLAPTIEVSLGLEPTLGTDFWQLVRPGPVDDSDGWPGRPTRVVLSEATRPMRENERDWNNQLAWRSVRVGDDALHTHPLKPGSAISNAPNGLQDLLGGLLSAWDAAAPPFRHEQMDAETAEALKALGYLEE